ncbi:polysaccharide deacetylase family protein [Kribbella sp. NPDC051770]|uniref:polysaccharide deacetylase family protein n=1 Tax=Kribbella sp. NPDC051770 TaxID=3155413 RepID=UPI0034470351
MSGQLARRTFLAAAAAAVVAGCNDTSGPDAAPVVADHTPIRPAAPAPSSGPASTSPAAASRPPTPSELGVIPVLMHHRLTPNVSGEYDMTPAFFRAELERLQREGYHPIRTLDLVRRDLSTVPAGKTPVVLTFDDSTPGQFALDKSGRVVPDTAMGILLAFQTRFPDFPAVASFYLNKSPFGLTGADVPRALKYLNDAGCELGNHTWDHPNLRHQTTAQAENEIARLAAMITSAVPAAPPRTLALPLGVHPRDRRVLASGGHGSTAYRNDGVLLVGAGPCPSPYSRTFDPMAVPRIRCSSYQGGRGDLLMDYWLDRLPRQKFVAASNNSKVVPQT